MAKKLTALILILGSFFTALAETIVVTSNGDSGPGTLREAIQKAAANGTSATDYIHFNLGGANASIILESDLPALTSNLVIDGTTQGGSKIGVSDGKVFIAPNRPNKNNSYCFFIENAHNIEIYGLLIFNFNSYIAADNNSPVHPYAILIDKANNIRIGAPGKGNSFYNNYGAIGKVSDGICENIFIQNNIIGLETLGYAMVPQNHVEIAYGINLKRAGKIFIGGESENLKNVIAGVYYAAIQLTIATDSVSISNNYIGTDLSGERLIKENYLSQNAITGPVIFNDCEGITLINNNVLPAGIKITNAKKAFKITRNSIGLSKNKSRTITNQGYIEIKNTYVEGIIGGSSTADGNIIANSQIGIKITGQSYPIKISHNSIYCHTEDGISIEASSVNRGANYPFVNIHSLSSNFVTGTATPNAVIELFTDDECINCEGKTYISKVTSDGDGLWRFDGQWTGAIVATATNKDGATSQFSKPVINAVKVENAACEKERGSINVAIESGTSWHWLDAEGKIISTDTNLVNVVPGQYKLVVKIGENGCQFTSPYFIINKISKPDFDVATISLKDATCNKSNGEFYTSATLNTLYDYQWIAADGQFTAITSGELKNISTGNYSLLVSVKNDNTCSSSFGPFVINNQAAPSLNLSNIKINNATCEGKNGSIKNITVSNVTGVPSIQWFDSLNKVVGTTIDLVNVPAGRYRLKFKDGSSCDTIITPYYTIINTGAIAIDTTALRVTASNCPTASGTITGIKTMGGEKYIWTDADNMQVSTNLNPGLLFPGQYTLTVTNQFGCEKKTEPITVATKIHNDQGLQFSLDRKVPRCDSSNGYLNVVNFPNAQQYTFRWVDSAKQNINLSTTTELKDFPSGLYFFYAKDGKGCEQRYVYAKFQPMPVPKIDDTNKQIGNDLCNQGVGFIKGLQVNSGIVPVTYSWIDENNNPVGHNLNLTDKASGKYALTAQNHIGCKAISPFYTISNQNRNLALPLYTDQTILTNTTATLRPSNQQAGTYYLFESFATTVPLQQNETGIFETGPLSTDKTYSIKLKIGTCESGMETVQIKVVDETKVFVPTAFSPNGDGKNDVLRPKAFGIFHLENFSVYNRWGGLVFQSADLSKGWNGQHKQADLPDGVYVWMIKGKDMKGNTIFQKGTTMLLR